MSSVSNYTYRYSTEEDCTAIADLIAQRFGEREGVLSNINGRYLLCFDEDKLVGMSGCSPSKRFNGYEIDWTCVAHDYEGVGVIRSLFEQLLDDCIYDVYCSCWRMAEHTHVNLQKHMDYFGFCPVHVPRVSCSAKTHKCCTKCVHYQPNCKCFEDLYIREGLCL